MKANYEKPVTEIEQFKATEAITTSANPGDDNDVTWPVG